MSKGDVRCIEGRLFRHDPQYDDPDLETDIGQCPECEGGGCNVGTEYIVLCGSIVGGDGRAFDTVYSFDGRRFGDRQRAIAYGFKARGSDDFNVGVIEDGRLVSIDWMEKTVDDDDDLMRNIAEQIGITP